MICTKNIQSIKIDTQITAHKNLNDNSIKNISFFIKVKKVSGIYIYCYGLSQRKHY